MKHTTQSYRGLMASTYSLFFQSSSEEYNFYRHFLESSPGPALELACGTGQLLREYIREGFDVQGVDSSSAMLEICTQQGSPQNLRPKLHCQPLEQLCLPQLYTTLYIPSCSFMLIQDWSDARQALDHFYQQLTSGGQLLVSLFIPWHEHVDAQNIFRIQRDVICADKRILLHQALSYHYVEQLRHGRYRFEVYSAERLENIELHDLWWRWYGRYEFEMMLQKAGFTDIIVYGDYTLEQPTADTDTLIFKAQKT